MGYLNRSEILAADDFVYEDVPLWGGTVRARGFSAAEREEFAAAYGGADKDLSKLKGAMAWAISRTIVDERGAAIFQPEDVEALGRKSAKSVEGLFKTVLRLSGMSEEAVADLGEGSAPTPNGASSSDSR
jgi:hypothetical protein